MRPYWHIQMAGPLSVSNVGHMGPLWRVGGGDFSAFCLRVQSWIGQKIVWSLECPKDHFCWQSPRRRCSARALGPGPFSLECPPGSAYQRTDVLSQAVLTIVAPVALLQLLLRLAKMLLIACRTRGQDQGRAFRAARGHQRRESRRGAAGRRGRRRERRHELPRDPAARVVRLQRAQARGGGARRLGAAHPAGRVGADHIGQDGGQCRTVLYRATATCTPRLSPASAEPPAAPRTPLRPATRPSARSL